MAAVSVGAVAGARLVSAVATQTIALPDSDPSALGIAVVIVAAMIDGIPIAILAPHNGIVPAVGGSVPVGRGVTGHTRTVAGGGVGGGRVIDWLAVGSGGGV